MLAATNKLTRMKDFTHFVSKEKQDVLGLRNLISDTEKKFASMDAEIQSLGGCVDMKIHQSKKLITTRMVSDEQLYKVTYKAIQESHVIIHRLNKILQYIKKSGYTR